MAPQEQEFSAVSGDSPGLGCSDRQGGSLDGLGRCQVWVKKRRCDQEAVGWKDGAFTW